MKKGRLKISKVYFSRSTVKKIQHFIKDYRKFDYYHSPRKEFWSSKERDNNPHILKPKKQPINFKKYEESLSLQQMAETLIFPKKLFSYREKRKKHKTEEKKTKTQKFIEKARNKKKFSESKK